jgi:MarR family transcriptional regulator for hemolysin
MAFLISDVARLMRTCVDQHAAKIGMTRAQWAVLVRLERAEGLKQAELADMLDLQPITLTRLVDRLCDNGLIERRSDPKDRRAKRLFLTAAAKPLLERLHALGEAVMTGVLDGVDDKSLHAMLDQLGLVKDNLRRMIQNRPAEDERRVRYG